MKWLNIPDFILTTCKTFKLPENEIKTDSYHGILTYLINAIQPLEIQQQKVEKNIEESVQLYSQECLLKKQELQQYETMLRKKIINNTTIININSKTTILSNRPSLTVLSYQNNLIKLCNQTVKYLSLKKNVIETQKNSYIELNNILKNLHNIRLLMKIVEQIEATRDQSFSFFINNLILIITHRGVFCIQLSEVQDISNIKNNVTLLFKNALGNRIDQLLVICNIKDFDSYNELKYCIGKDELELLELYCSKMIELTKRSWFNE